MASRGQDTTHGVPLLFSLQGWSHSEGRYSEREWAAETLSCHVSRTWPTVGGPTVDHPSQAPQPCLRFESLKDVDSGHEGLCLSRTGLVLFHYLVHSTNLLAPTGYKHKWWAKLINILRPFDLVTPSFASCKEMSMHPWPKGAS